MTGERPGGPGDALVVSGGGTTLVATDTLLEEASRLLLLQADTEDWLGRLTRIQALDSDPSTGPIWGAAPDAGVSVYAARHVLSAVLERSAGLAEALLAAAEGYGRADRLVEWGTRLSGAWLGNTLGMLAPILALAAVPALTAGAVGLLLGLVVTGTRVGDPAAMAGAWLQAHPRALTNPVLVAAVRVLVSSVDDVAAGRAGVPFPVSFALGDEGAGVFGVTTTAGAAVVAARSLGLLRETPVSVERLDASRPGVPPPAPAPGGPPPQGSSAAGTGASTRPVAPPTGFGDLAARIPSVSADAPQVRIERYGDADDASWIVYIGGTAAWSPVTGDQPWDLTSNLAAVADQGAGSYRAVVQALHEAGVAPGDPVVPVGHSQGGLVAAQLAASGEFNTVMVATFGAPNGQVTLPPEVSAVTVEHSDDLIPAAGGAASADDERLIVRREVFFDRIPPSDQALPAHALTEYRNTGRLMDGSDEPRLREFRAALEGVTGTDAGDSSRWRGIRLVGGSGGAPPTSGG